MNEVIEKAVTVSELKSLYGSDDYVVEIDTPDGYQVITDWFDKGVMSMVQIGTENHQTECATNHLIQLADGKWALAGELSVGDSVITKTGVEEVVLIENVNEQECYDFTIDHPNHRYWGDGFSSHNSGKSYLCSGNLVKNAQDQGIFVVLIDSENALDEKWLHALNVDTSEDKLLKLNMAMIDDVAKVITEFMKSFKDDYSNVPDEDRPKILFVIDSLGMLMSPTDVDQFNKGDMKGDMGRKPKMLKTLVTNCVNMFGEYNVGMVATNHTYESQDMFDPDQKISGGAGFIFASSIVVAIRKLKLKEDEDGNKTSAVNGIRAACKIMKTRYAKPFETVQIKIPYDTGMNPYSGLVDMAESAGILTKSGNRLSYIGKETGEEILKFRKAWENNEDGCLDMLMEQWDTQIDDSSEEDEEEYTEVEETIVEDVNADE